MPAHWSEIAAGFVFALTLGAWTAALCIAIAAARDRGGVLATIGWLDIALFFAALAVLLVSLSGAVP